MKNLLSSPKIRFASALCLSILLLSIPMINLNADDSEPLPRWREGETPYDPNQSLEPFMLQPAIDKDMPSSGVISAPPEYDSSRGVIFQYSTNGWPTVVRDLVAGLTGDPAHDEIAYVVVTNTSQMNNAISSFLSAGADTSKVEFIIEPTDAIWIRDYGPHFIWQDSALAIANSQYYPTRSLDNFIPELLGSDHFQVPTYDMGLYYSGGNFLPGPYRSGYVTGLVNLDNPSSAGFDASFIAELYQAYQGIDTLHVMPQLPSSVDLTGHIDMWMYIIDDTTVIISEFLPGSNSTAISITNNAVTYMEDRGFTVYRTPAWNAPHPDYGYNTHWTYTNALRVNDRIFISTFGETYLPYADEDAQALAVWQAAAGPDVEIVQINSYPIIWAAGAIHCITMQVPHYGGSQPAVHLIWPNGGELFAGNSTELIQWGAIDTDNQEIPEIVLYYSTDNGSTYELIDTVPNTGEYLWTVPDIYADQALVKVVAIASDADQFEDVSDASFEVASCDQFVYDFSSGAGVDKFCYGYHTLNWSYIDGNRTPVMSEISSSNYDRLAASDATGTDYDPNRYITPDPSNSFESTHIFEFTIQEDISEIDDIEILWEGYSDNCAMMEMYIWDYTANQWCDTDGLFNQNRFVDSWAGNRDGILEKHIRSDYDRFIDGNGQFTVLLYSERGPDGSYITYNPSFHDYIAVTVSDILPQYLCGDANSTDDINVSDAVYIVNFIFVQGAPPDPMEAADVNCDGDVNVSDAVWIINSIFTGGNLPCDIDGDGQPDC